MFGLFRKTRAEVEAARRLYPVVLEQSRQPEMYRAGDVPDTPEGRFEALTLHMAVVLRRFRGHGEQAAEVAQALFDVMFDDMDAALRELGVGDLTVAKRIKKMGEAFYGRAAAYDAALAQDDASAIAQALRRNLYVDTEPAAQALNAMTAYAKALDEAVRKTPLERLVKGEAPVLPAWDANAAA